MSIRDRLEDAQLLFSNGRRDGALLSVLVAVAATSRKRYKRSEVRFDRDAFIRFLLDELPVIVPSDWVPVCEDHYIRSIEPEKVLDAQGNHVGGWWIQVPGASAAGWPEGLMPLAACLYFFVRNSLAHEASLPDNVKFVEGEQGHLTFEVLEDRVRISNSLMTRLKFLAVI